MFDAYPLPESPSFEEYSMSIISCWCRKDRQVGTVQAAADLAVPLLLEEGWGIARLLQASLVGAARYSEPGPGFVEFREALEFGFQAHFHRCWREIIDTVDVRRCDRPLLSQHGDFVANVLNSEGAMAAQDTESGAWAEVDTPAGATCVPLWTRADPSVSAVLSPRQRPVFVPMPQLMEEFLPQLVAGQQLVACGFDGALVTTHPALLRQQLTPS